VAWNLKRNYMFRNEATSIIEAMLKMAISNFCLRLKQSARENKQTTKDTPQRNLIIPTSIYLIPKTL
jgi:hypothetical protein